MKTKTNYVPNVLSPEAIFLIGYPGSGKSTWLKAFFDSKPERLYTVLSSDNLLYELAARDGIDYNTAHGKYHAEIIPELIARMYGSVKHGNSIIIDQTNLDPAVRAEKLAMIPAHYHKKAIVFEVPIEVLIARQKAPERLAMGKVIPEDVFVSMQAVYCKPDLNEFDEIVTLTM